VLPRLQLLLGSEHKPEGNRFHDAFFSVLRRLRDLRVSETEEGAHDFEVVVHLSAIDRLKGAGSAKQRPGPKVVEFPEAFWIRFASLLIASGGKIKRDALQAQLVSEFVDKELPSNGLGNSRRTMKAGTIADRIARAYSAALEERKRNIAPYSKP